MSCEKSADSTRWNPARDVPVYVSTPAVNGHDAALPSGSATRASRASPGTPTSTVSPVRRLAASAPSTPGRNQESAFATNSGNAARSGRSDHDGWNATYSTRRSARSQVATSGASRERAMTFTPGPVAASSARSITTGPRASDASRGWFRSQETNRGAVTTPRASMGSPGGTAPKTITFPRSSGGGLPPLNTARSYPSSSRAPVTGSTASTLLASTPGKRFSAASRNASGRPTSSTRRDFAGANTAYAASSAGEVVGRLDPRGHPAIGGSFPRDAQRHGAGAADRHLAAQHRLPAGRHDERHDARAAAARGDRDEQLHPARGGPPEAHRRDAGVLGRSADGDDPHPRPARIGVAVRGERTVGHEHHPGGTARLAQAEGEEQAVRRRSRLVRGRRSPDGAPQGLAVLGEGHEHPGRPARGDHAHPGAPAQAGREPERLVLRLVVPGPAARARAHAGGRVEHQHRVAARACPAAADEGPGQADGEHGGREHGREQGEAPQEAADAEAGAHVAQRLLPEGERRDVAARPARGDGVQQDDERNEHQRQQRERCGEGHGVPTSARAGARPAGGSAAPGPRREPACPRAGTPRPSAGRTPRPTRGRPRAARGRRPAPARRR